MERHPNQSTDSSRSVFRWETGNPDWSISDKSGLKDDFKLALQKDYKVRWATTTPPQPDPLATTAINSAIEYKPWMLINTGASLYQFASSNNLGCPQTDEFKFIFNNATYICQVYNGGIVYVKEGDWGNSKWVVKFAGA